MTLPVRRSVGQALRPLRPFEDLYAEVDRLAQSVIGGRAAEGAWLPAADLTETDDAYIVEVELPGVRREDIDVEMNGNELVVTGELKERKREGLLRRRSRRVGDFEYRVTLPGDLRDKDVQASLANGVLTLRVPKAKSTKTHKIRVTESGNGAVRADPRRGHVAPKTQRDPGKPIAGVGTLNRFLRAIVNWVRAGYPEGIPPKDSFPVLALLSRRLTDDEVKAVATELARRGDFDNVDIGAAISQITDQSPSPEDVERVRARLAENGWPLDDPRDAEESR